MREPKNKNDLMWHLVVWDDLSTFPKTDDYILLHFENFSLCCVGRCEGNEEEGYSFFEGDNEKSLMSYGLFVDAWMPLPERWEE